MFKISKDPQFSHDVPVHVPVDDGHQEQILRTRFRVVASEDLAEHDLSSAEGTEAYLRAIVVRFENVIDETERPVAADAALTDELLGLPFVRVAVIRAYTAAMVKAKQGN